jgi:glycosyltransferase involved in cell wall biosynthesis
MKIIDVNPFFFPYKGGIERRMHDTSRLLAARGHDVTVLTSRLSHDDPEEERTPEGYRIVRLKSRQIKVYNPPFISSPGVREAIESMGADVINYNYRWAPSYNNDIARYDGPKVFTVHNMWGEGTGIQAKLSEINDRMFVKRCLSTFDEIVSVSESLRVQTIGRGVSADKVTTVPNCLSEFPQVTDEEGDFILSLGRLVPVKGLEYLVEAMRDVDCRLIVCGKGPAEKSIADCIRKYGLEDKVEMRGYVPEEEKQRLMSTCRLFVIPSLSEAFGIAALEQLSYGRPVVSTNVNGLPETIGNGGILVPPKDPSALSGAINDLLSDSALRSSYRERSRAQAESFAWDRHIGTLEDVFRKAMERR